MADVLLMTATIDPGRSKFVTVDDPRVRLHQYIMSLILWSKLHLFGKIIFCENSRTSYNLEVFGEIAEREQTETEILLIDNNSGSWKYGKSWGEARIIESVFRYSKFLSMCSGFYKVTGRLFLRNAARIIESHKNDTTVFSGGESRFFKSEPKFFEQTVIPHYRDIHEPAGRTIEYIHREALKSFIRPQVVPFSESLDFLGQCGGSGEVYGEFPLDIRAEANYWLPAFGSHTPRWLNENR